MTIPEPFFAQPRQGRGGPSKVVTIALAAASAVFLIFVYYVWVLVFIKHDSGTPLRALSEAVAFAMLVIILLYGRSVKKSGARREPLPVRSIVPGRRTSNPDCWKAFRVLTYPKRSTLSLLSP